MTLHSNEYSVTILHKSICCEDLNEISTKYIDLDDYIHSEMYSIFFIHIINSLTQMDITVLGDYNCDSEDCAVIRDNTLTVLQGNDIYDIDMNSGTVLKHMNYDYEYGCLYNLFSHDDFFIVHGEEYILRIDNDLNVVWFFSGKDIFFTPDDTVSFFMDKNHIHLVDFNFDEYDIDYNGKTIDS